MSMASRPVALARETVVTGAVSPSAHGERDAFELELDTPVPEPNSSAVPADGGQLRR